MELSDEFLRSTSKRSRQEDDVQTDTSLLDNSGGSSMASWLGTDSDKEDFVMMSDMYLSSSQLVQGERYEDDRKAKEDDLRDRNEGGVVLTLQLAETRGQDDRRDCPRLGLEDGEDQEVIPDQTPSSSSSTVGGGESSTDELTSAQNTGEECLTNAVVRCSFEGMVFLDVSCSQGGDGTFTFEGDNSQDTTISRCPDRRQDEGMGDNILVSMDNTTLTPSSVEHGEGSYSVLNNIATRGWDNGQDLLLVIPDKEDRTQDDKVANPCGFAEIDSRHEGDQPGEARGDTGDNTIKPCSTGILTPSVGPPATTDTGKKHTSTNNNFTCAALPGVLQMPGDLISAHPTTPGLGYAGSQEDHVLIGRGAPSLDRDPFPKELREGILLSHTGLIPPVECEAGAESCLTQDTPTEPVHERGQGDPPVHDRGVQLPSSIPDTEELLEGGLIPSITSEAGTELSQAQLIVDHGAQEDVMSDNTLGLSDEVPPSQAMILLPDNSEAGTEHCQAEMPEEQQGGKDDTNDSKKLYRAGTEDTLSVVGRRGCSHDKRGFCSTHGCLGVKKTRLIPCVMKNADGVKFKSTKKKYYYECEMGPRGQGVLRQTRLSFSRTPSLSSRNGDGHDRGESTISSFHRVQRGSMLGGLHRQQYRTVMEMKSI